MPSNGGAAGQATITNQSWLGDKCTAVVAKAAHKQVGLVSGQAGKTGWGRGTWDPYAHNLAELDDGKEEGGDGETINTGGQAGGDVHGDMRWSTVMDR